MIRTLTPALFLLTAGGAIADPPNAEADRGLLVLEPSSSRSVFRTDRAASDVELCVTQVNRHAREGEPLLPGDRFEFRLPPGCGTFTGACATRTDSVALTDADVQCTLRPGSAELTVLAAAAFAPGDRICAVVTVEAPSPTGCAAEFRLAPRATPLPPHAPHGVHRIANVAQPSFLTWDVVDPLSGPTGELGATGPTGSVGGVGDVGSAGAAGAVGTIGIMGAHGATGATGPAGPLGSAGPRGALGDAGSPGTEGQAGLAGPTGPQGAAGTEGFPGTAGPSGAQGPPGVAGTGSATDCRKLFYITRTLHHADEAPTACDAGFHFASGPEIADWTHLRYDTGRGLQAADSGYGPPAYDSAEVPDRGFWHYMGWLRTGQDLSGGTSCDAWTVRDPSRLGRAALIRKTNSARGTIWLDSYVGVHAHCDDTLRVWCMEN